MSGQWKIAKLGDVCRIIPGFAFKSHDWKVDGIPVVKIKNITNTCSVDLTDTDFVSESIVTEKIEKYLLKIDDILVAMTGATAGKVGRVRTDRPVLLNQRVAKIEPVEADRGFIWAVVSSEKYQDLFFSLADGAAQPNMSGSQIEGVEIPLPPLPIQRRIASILSAYDDLIENNRKRIAILEDMARRLYREWFVHFRYPGHESVPLVDSPLGRIPQGWSWSILGDIADVNHRQLSPATAPDTIRYIDIASVSPGNIDSITPMDYADAPSRARRMVQDGDILWSCVRPNRRSHALLLEPEPDTIASTGFAVLSSRTVPWTYLYQATTTDGFVGYLVGRAQGAAYPAVRADDFAAAQILVPDIGLLAQFHSIAEPWSRLNENFRRQSLVLRRTRDLLLPRLMSGTLSVEALAAAEAAVP